MSPQKTASVKKKDLSLLIVIPALGLFLVAFVAFVKNEYQVDVTMAVILGLGVILLMSNRLANITIGPKGMEASLAQGVRETARAVDETREAVDRLRIQVDATALTNVFTQVSTMNRLVIERPELARVWEGFAELDEQEIREIFYIYVFLDAFEVLRQVSTGKPLSKDYYNVWRRTWIRELLQSKAGRTMKDMGLLDYYPEVTRDLLGI